LLGDRQVTSHKRDGLKATVGDIIKFTKKSKATTSNLTVGHEKNMRTTAKRREKMQDELKARGLALKDKTYAEGLEFYYQ